VLAERERLVLKARDEKAAVKEEEQEAERDVAARLAAEQDEEQSRARNAVEDGDEDHLLSQENERLYSDLRGLDDQLQQVESKVVKIAELQDVFAEKVLQQSADVELIGRQAVATTENVKDGNEELRKAIQNQASVRVYVLFFLLVMSFSLLFLDWYND